MSDKVLVREPAPFDRNTEQDLLAAFQVPFPIRGWKFKIELSPDPEAKQYVLYGSAPRVHGDRTLIAGEQPEVMRVLSSHIKVSASFRIERSIRLLGKLVELTPDGIDKQLVRVNMKQAGLTILIEGKGAPVFFVESYHPDPNAFAAAVGQWAGRKMKFASNTEEHQTAVYVLAQLHAIRENTLTATQNMLATLGNQIRQVPDYWTIVELLLRQVLKPEHAIGIAPDVIKIRAYEDAGLGPHVAHPETLQ